MKILKSILYFITLSVSTIVMAQSQKEVLNRLETILKEYTQINNSSTLYKMKVTPEFVRYTYYNLPNSSSYQTESVYIDLKEANWTVNEYGFLVSDRPAVFSVSSMGESSSGSFPIILASPDDSLIAEAGYGFRCDCKEIYPVLAAHFQWLKESALNPEEKPSVKLPDLIPPDYFSAKDCPTLRDMFQLKDLDFSAIDVACYGGVSLFFLGSVL